MQTNVQRGPIIAPAGENLTGKEDFLAALNADGEAVLPNALTDLALYAIQEGGEEGDDVTLIPLEPGQQVRLKLDGAVEAGAVLALAAIDGTKDGKVRTIPATAGQYFSPGTAEEDGVDGQLVKVRPFPRLTRVATVVALTSTNGTMAAAVDDAAIKAEGEKIGDDVRAIHAALVTHGIVTAA